MPAALPGSVLMVFQNLGCGVAHARNRKDVRLGLDRISDIGRISQRAIEASPDQRASSKPVRAALSI